MAPLTRGTWLSTVAAAAVVASAAAAVSALPAGDTCSCAVLPSSSVGRCLTFVPSSLDATTGQCNGKDCEASWGCVDASVATHECRSRAVGSVATCDSGEMPPTGESCQCGLVRSSETTLAPMQALSPRSARGGGECKPVKVCLQKVLSAKGRKLKLPDGRTLTATVKSVLGCKPRSGKDKTGTAKGTMTRLSQGPDGPSCTLRGGTYTGFQAIRVRVSGGTMVPSMTFEDVDATTKKASEAKSGWRETMTAVGRMRSTGAVVLPVLSVPKKALTGVFSYKVSGKSLGELGWGKRADLPVQGISYASWSHVYNIKDKNTWLARGYARFDQPIDELVVVYGLSQADTRKTALTSAFVSAVTMGC